MLLRFSLALSVVTLLAACESGDPPTAQDSDIFTATSSEAADLITEDYLREHIAILSDDALRGRGPATEGDATARTHLATEMEKIGFSPGAAGGSWEQPFGIVSVSSQNPDDWSFSKQGSDISFKHWDEYVATSGVQSDVATISDAEVVFVGYGIQAPEYEWDDFKGQDLSGKVLLMLNNDPDWDPELFAGPTRLYYGRWTYKYESAARQGAVGAIIIHTSASAGYPFQVVQTGWSGEQFELPAGDEPRVQVTGWLSRDAANRLVAHAGLSLGELTKNARSRDFEPVPLGVTTSIELTTQVSQVETANVIGVLEGSDPRLSDEYVVYTAHHDHLGVGKPNAAGDDIYNGARDNASGSSMLLAIGRAIASHTTPPRRSVMLLFVGAEEQGLLGSKYYATNPTVHPRHIAANLNFDAANIWGRTTDVVLIGLGKSNLDDVAHRVAQHQGRTIKGDQFPDRGVYYRSDQFSFAKIGVPAMYLNSGIDFEGRPEGWGTEQINAYNGVNYHQPSDSLGPEWDFGGMVQDARMGYWTGLIVANSDKMPAWTPGDEFEAARLAARSSLE